MSDYAQSLTRNHGKPVRLGFGLVQIPVRLYFMADDEPTAPARSMFTADGNPVGQQLIDKSTGKPVDRADVVKCANVDGAWIELTDAEIEACSTLTPGIASIDRFVPVAVFRDRFVETKPLVWRPDTMKVGKSKVVDPAAAKACALLRAVMARDEVVALVLVPTTRGAQYVALHADGSAGEVAYAAQVRPVPALDDIEVSAAEMKLAGELVGQIGVSDAPLVDDMAGSIREYLQAKAGDPIAALVAAIEPAAAKPVDLMAQLSASIDAAKASKPKRSKKVA